MNCRQKSTGVTTSHRKSGESQYEKNTGSRKRVAAVASQTHDKRDHRRTRYDPPEYLAVIGMAITPPEDFPLVYFTLKMSCFR